LTNDKALAYGHQGLTEHEVSKVEEVRSSKGRNGKITVRLQKQRAITTSPLYYKYDIQKYDLHPNYYFDKVTHMIPSGVPEYIDAGNQYVERIIRAMFHFKQCALIGPSGTGKTHIIYLVAELTAASRPAATTSSAASWGSGRRTGSTDRSPSGSGTEASSTSTRRT